MANDNDWTHEARSRRLWLAVRRALLAICAAIAREYGVGDDAQHPL